MDAAAQVVVQELAHPRGRTRIVSGIGVLSATSWSAEGANSLADWLAGRTLFILKTPHVDALHGARLASLCGAAQRVVELVVADGEGAKSVRQAEQLWNAMLTAGGKRDSRLLTFGGGSVGDLGGFVAGCFLRGIPYLQVPTTLLAQVDAAIGGKTAVDLPGGKNTVGLFHHPDWVLADTDLLTTLPRSELSAGLVEVIKMAFLLDLELLARVERDLEALLAAEVQALAPVVAAAIAVKCRVVMLDPEERDQRRWLNFGHTLGHALEGVLGYTGLRHGEAVAYGLLFALRLALLRGLPRPAAERLHQLLCRLPLPALPELDALALVDFMWRDKKATEQGLVWVLPQDLGRGVMVNDLGREQVLAELRAFLLDPWSLPAPRT